MVNFTGSALNALRIQLGDIERIARECGLTLVGVIPAAPAEAELARQRERFVEWQRRGYAGDMAFMKRSPELFTSLRHFLPEVRSIISFAIPYECGRPHEPHPGFGWVARYAWGEDYHTVLRERLKEFVDKVSRERAVENELRWRSFSDAVPLLERPLAALAELGFIGKNTLLIRPKLGSYFVLAEVLWNIVVDGFGDDLTYQTDGAFEEKAAAKAGASCGSCSRCIDSCPTDAIVADGVIDARRCVSYLTIEKRGELNKWERHALGRWVFGCDTCQEVCPFNHSPKDSLVDLCFRSSRGAGAYLDLKEVLKLRTVKQFRARFGNTAIMRATREGLLRNVCCVIANSRFFEAAEELRSVFREDPSELVRKHAELALEDLALDATGLDRLRVSL